MLENLDQDHSLNKDNIIRKLQERLQKVNPTVCKHWERNHYDLDYTFRVGYLDYTLLYLSVRFNCVSIVKILLDIGANINVLEELELGATVLNYAAMDESTEILELLLNSDINNENIGKALIFAACSNKIKTVEVLLQEDINVSYLGNARHVTIHNRIRDLIQERLTRKEDDNYEINHRLNKAFIKERKYVVFYENLEEILCKLNRKENLDISKIINEIKNHCKDMINGKGISII
ncbi:ankyrin repeat domain-containing protein [Wolbachia pipientis]|uniref:ankyrin repeat domain-containing protein n=1 Tax=Wolbachia pipientis TaxID=955 RepID=UPI0009C19073|nr:ankyrin repeat domain-containing protein [Wolbachia pipientis]